MTGPVLHVRELSVHYPRRSLNPFKALPPVRAVDGVTLTIGRGQTLGLVGESGCGKSSLARAILRLTPVTRGHIVLNGSAIEQLQGRALRTVRRSMQLIFQDPYSSLNPRVRAGNIVRSPLDVLGIGSDDERRQRVAELFAAVGLRPEQQDLFPHQFSGGQRQRINIARALAPSPSLIVCDEPVSALDVAIRAQILNLLTTLQKDLGLTYLFISHDMGVIRHVADIVAVMYLGEIVEQAPKRAFFAAPRHPYSRALLSAVPSASVKAQRVGRMQLSGDPPSPTAPPPGCRFATRCPMSVPACSITPPPLKQIAVDHYVRCDLVT